jgi:hypothetical protein
MRKPIAALGRFKFIGKENLPLSAREDPEPSISDVDEHLILYPIRKAASHDPETKAIPTIRSHSPSHSALPESNRFYPFHEPRKGPPTEDFIGMTPALQFLPSYEESNPRLLGQKSNYIGKAKTANCRKSRDKTFSTDQQDHPYTQPEWDAVIEADDGSKSSKGSWRGRKKSTREKSRDSISSSEDKKSSFPNSLSIKRKTIAKKSVRSPPKFILSDDASFGESASDIDTTSKKGHRIARLASMFGNRTGKTEKVYRNGTGTTRSAAMKLKAETNPQSKIPNSPAVSHVSSSSSAGFVGWPGTQDKQGKVVAIESSYDDSSVGFIAFKDNAVVTSESQTNRNAVMTSSKNGKNSIEKAADFHLQAIVQELRLKPKTRASQAVQLVSDSENTAMRKQTNQSTILNPMSTSRDPVEGTSVAGTSASTALSILNLFERDSQSYQEKYTFTEADPWDIDSSSHPPSSPGTSVSKNSSAFFHLDRGPNEGTATFADLDSFYGVRKNIKGVESIIRRKPQEMQPANFMSRQIQNDSNPTPGVFRNSHGLQGLIDNRHEVPNLMDDDIDDSDSLASEPPERNPSLKYEPSTQMTQAKSKGLDDESDVFDDISRCGNSTSGLKNIQQVSVSSTPDRSGLHMIAPTSILSKPITKDDNYFNLVKLPGGLQAIQTSQKDYKTRHTSYHFDENLSTSDVDQHGFIKVPGVDDMIKAGRKVGGGASYFSVDADTKGIDVHTSRFSYTTSSENDQTGLQKTRDYQLKKDHKLPEGFLDRSVSIRNGIKSYELKIQNNDPLDLTKYKIYPDQSKKLIRAYREMSEALETENMTIDCFNKFEDSKKAFALSEMRSRIMEKDLDRGLERRGGSAPVDDIVLTPYFQASYRVRDIVIVSKAWRDGATPYDVFTAMNMTRRNEKTYYVTRISKSYTSPSGLSTEASYWWEKVAWIDDTDVIQIRCPSLGSRNMRGFEIFSIGDCQSILLKLAHEQCVVSAIFWLKS